ncbi:MAG: hypothetical protein HUU16_15050 [Candidatus Omnitrophica bacterium]|nr:hypothetical protein [bacterium]NUN97478.1 hypothetical protein [Candidatus Omnitrophota bacterium]
MFTLITARKPIQRVIVAMHLLLVAPTESPSFTADLQNERSDINQDGVVNSDDLLIFLRDWHGTDPAPQPTFTVTQTIPPSITPSPTGFDCIPEYAWLQRDLPETCRGESPFEVQFTIQGGTALITDVFETVPAGWQVLSPTPFVQMENTVHWDHQIFSYTIVPPAGVIPGDYMFEGETKSYHWCNGEVTRPITGDTIITCQPAFPTPTPTCPCLLPDLIPVSMYIGLEPGHDCSDPVGRLGTYATVMNQGEPIAGTFVIRVNGAEAVVQDLADGQSTTSWVPAVAFPEAATMTVDVYNQIQEGNETNNELVDFLPIPAPPPTCTQTPTPLVTPTPTPTSERGFLIPVIGVSPNPVRGGETVTLDGTSSMGIINSFQWEFVWGSYGAVLQNATGSIAADLLPKNCTSLNERIR